MLSHGVFFEYMKRYLAHHTVSKDFTVDDAVMADFKNYLKSEKIDYTDADFNTNQAWLKTNIRSQLFISQFGANAGFKVARDEDPALAKALTFMPEALALEERSDKSRETKTASIK